VVKGEGSRADTGIVAPANRLQALLDLSHRLSSSLDLNDVLRDFSERASELTGATAAEISRWKRDENNLVMLVEYLQGKDEITVGGGQVYPLGEYPATKLVLETQEPKQIRVSDETADPCERAFLERRGLRSLLMLPLVARGETIGLMEVIDTSDREFDVADVDFCRALCDVVATAVRNAMLYSEVEELAARDRLTGLYNRRLFEEQLEVAVARSVRTGEELSLLVVDVDGLKRINDGRGHLAGNRALCRLAESIRASCRAIDTPARFGGDEFAMILPEADEAEALGVAQRTRQRLAADPEQPALTTSVGVAMYPRDGDTIERLLGTADRALYGMKKACA